MRKPTFVTLCGSTRYSHLFAEINRERTLAGEIVMSIGARDTGDKQALTPEEKDKVDKLHLWKIDASDYVYVINADGYIGDSTMQEIAYAVFTKTPLRFYEMEAGKKWLDSPEAQHKLGAMIGAFMLKGPPHRLKDEKPSDGLAVLQALVSEILNECSDPDCPRCGKARADAKKVQAQ